MTTHQPVMSPKATRLLAWLGGVTSGRLLEAQVVAGGYSSALNELLRAGFADIDADPRVRERGAPAASVLITAKGRDVLAEHPNH